MFKIRLTLEQTEGDGYTVTSPDVPGLVTEGSTPAEIYRNVQEAIEALMMGWAELGKEPPPALREGNRPISNAEILVAV